MLKNRNLRKRLKQIGSSVDISFMVYVNNDDPVHFRTQEDCFNYLKQYRSENIIFKLQLYRIETFSL